MLEFFITKIYSIIFILSLLNVVMNFYKIIRSWASSENGEPIRYKISKKDVFFVGLSLSYVISSLIYGITN